MDVRAVEGARVRVGFRTLISLALCAAAAGAALAHSAIDFVGDFALAHDSYDNLQHGSRELMTGVALLLAMFLAASGLRICCDIAATNRTRLLRPVLRSRETLSMLGAAIAASVALVPAMEYLDGRFDGMPVRRLSDAFGGSIPLGLATTVVCATIVALVVYAVARWLISHRDSIATIIETFLHACADAVAPSGYDRIGQQTPPRRRRAPSALRLSKRGPPATTFA